jgi:hypothetical protein
MRDITSSVAVDVCVLGQAIQSLLSLMVYQLNFIRAFVFFVFNVMLVEIVIFHWLLHVLNDLFIYDLLPANQLFFLYFFVWLLITIIVNVDGAIFVHH